MQTRTLSMVSDRAKALVKLAETGLECPRIPDWFPLLHALGKGYALALATQLQTARQTLRHAQQHLDKCKTLGTGVPEIESAQAEVVVSAAAVEHGQQGRDTYRGHLEMRSLQGHPWRVTASMPQSAHEVDAQLTAEGAALQAWLETHGVPVKKTVRDTVRKQLAGLAAVIDVWGHQVRQDVQNPIALTPRGASGVEENLRPLMSWEPQVARTRCPRRQAKLVEALEAVQASFEAHHLTAQLPIEVLAGWQTGAAEHAKTFQRASSAVAGRNGSLSQRHHHHRGLPQRRSQVWRALDNFACRASDGSTPASRLFRQEFPHLFEAVLSQLDELPRARKRQPAMVTSY
jgi:Family of unknown function (DUF6399)